MPPTVVAALPPMSEPPPDAVDAPPSVPPCLPPSVPGPPEDPAVRLSFSPPATTSPPAEEHALPVNWQMAPRISPVSWLPTDVAVIAPTKATTINTRPRYSIALCPPSRRAANNPTALKRGPFSRSATGVRNHPRTAYRHSSTMTTTVSTSCGRPPVPAPA